MGLFPVVTPLIARLTLRPASARRVAAVQLGLLIGCLAPLALVMATEAAREYLGLYWRQQVLASVSGAHDGVWSLFGQLKILGFLLRDLQFALLFAVLLAGAGFLAQQRRRPSPCDMVAAPSWRFCLLTARSASLPLVACPKQHGHYTAPSWPFFAMAMAMGLRPGLLALLNWAKLWAKPRWLAGLRIATAAAMLVTVGYSVRDYGEVYRDADIIRRSDQIASCVGHHGIAVIEPDSWARVPSYDQLRLHAYLFRDHCVSLWSEQPDAAILPEHQRLRMPDMVIAVAYEPFSIDGIQGYSLSSGLGMAAASHARRK